MGNVIQIKHGASTPNQGVLQPYELGYALNGGLLIGDKDGRAIPVVPVITLDGLGITATTDELNKLSGMKATTNELNKLSGLTASTAELNKLSGLTASTAELNILKGVTAKATELNYCSGVNSAIQTQLNNKVPTTRTINSKALSSDITLKAEDVKARADTWMPTAAEVGALPQKCTYYAKGSTVSADTCNDSFALFASSLVGSTLTKLLGDPGFIYIFTFYYADSNYKLQIAFPYNLASSAVAVRQSNSGTWKAWTRIDNHAPLTGDQYGTTLPDTGVMGQIFFKKVT